MNDSERHESLSKVEWAPDSSLKDSALPSKIVEDRHEHRVVSDCFQRPENCRFISIFIE